ncbi:MAG: threonine--tRNA ligase [Candidatus Delongbacteria bacterium]|nr:threonine--tRNA ligase [Candidatus Delongbacteria bacterium]MCG2761214.1 threonine--tRNA ligase [Candidatus Delongbacteria bacterium]
MIKIIFPDGIIKEYAEQISAIEIAKNISPSFAKEVLAVEINGKLCDLNCKLNADSEINFLKFSDLKGKEVYWHSTSHIMAQAVVRLFPNIKVAIGPAIEHGFYYDFEAEPFSDDDLASIEKEVQKIIKENQKFERKEVSRGEALKYFKERNEIYKVELIEALPEGEIISMYSNGEFTDLCRGPHLLNTAMVKKFKILSSSGAYWRGDSKNTMLQRIYGISFPTSEELDLFLKIREEAEKRDHRRLGRELNLFAFFPEAPGSPFYKHNGLIIFDKLIEYWREEHAKDDYKEIKTPVVMKRSLWEKSGHWENYRENMFTSEIEGDQFVIKPMNCPGGILLFNSELYSYKDLPVRMSEIGLDHRNEFSGALSGLFRVRAFHMDDAHIFMTPAHIKQEIIGVIKLFARVYKTFGLDYHLELSTRPEKSIGTDEAWEIAIIGLRDALDSYGEGYKVNEGDGAFYGPKIDFKIHDALGREWQCGTIQLDMNLPERFDVTYIDENSDKKRAVMIHRALYGSIERFLGIIIEHFGGFFPLWLAPVQVSVIPVSDRFNDFAKEVYDKLIKDGFRAEFDDRSEKVGYKIREAEAVKKIPYMLVIGDKEKETGKFTVRQHKKGNIGEFEFDSFVNKIEEEREKRILPEGYKLEL